MFLIYSRQRKTKYIYYNEISTANYTYLMNYYSENFIIRDSKL
jgi:hypothetical protein